MAKHSYFYRPKRETAPEKPKRWKPLAIIWTALKRTCTVLGAMILLSAIISTCTVLTLANQAGTITLPDDMALVFTVEEGIAEVQTKPTLLDPFPFLQPTLRNIVSGIDRAAEDPRVRTLIFNMRGGSVNVTQAEEIRDAILRFRESGKQTIIYSSSYDSGAGGLIQYYLASAFDEIWMQPVGMLSITGLNFEMPFLAGTLEKLGVQAQFLRRAEYKTAVENFTNRNISPENEEMLQSILDSWSTVMTTAIAENRNIDLDDLSLALNKGLLTGTEAYELGLIDRLDYGDAILPKIQLAAAGYDEDPTVSLVNFKDYVGERRQAAAERKSKTGNNVALVHVAGTIVSSSDTPGQASAVDLAEAIGLAIADDSIQAIIVRIDSPGGSPTASETIRHALAKAKADGKPVYVSMGSTAASGGYWIATEGQRIFASPGTLTGSIGVVMGKFELSGLWEKIDANWQGPQVGANADLWSINEPFDDAALTRLNVLIDNTYEEFLIRVAQGRDMPMDRVREIAKGRAYTGAQALELGLVDEMGGLDETLSFVAEDLAFEGGRDSMRITKFPRELDNLERFLELIGHSVSLPAFIQNAKDSKMESIILPQMMLPQWQQAKEEIDLITQAGPILTYEPLAGPLSQTGGKTATYR